MTTAVSLAQAPNTLPKIWQAALRHLEQRIPQHQLASWLRPLSAHVEAETLFLKAPSQFAYQWVKKNLWDDILKAVADAHPGHSWQVELTQSDFEQMPEPKSPIIEPLSQKNETPATQETEPNSVKSHLNPLFTFDTFVEGKANQLPYAAAKAVAESPGEGYNPFFVYGGVGLGKTHLIQAIGNELKRKNPQARVVYMSSEKFVADMVNALQHKKIAKFQKFYRSLDALLIDDIQFFAGKTQTQEEFFHTFNTLLEGNKQVIMTSDRLPKEVEGLEDRLKSRFGWGLSLAIEPPELEMRIAILLKKAQLRGMELPDDVAFFIAKHLHTNIRELEGALNRLLAFAQFKRTPITLDLAQEALKDILVVQEKSISIENIQKQVAKYFDIRLSDLLSKKRARSIARPRQLAMALCKELTQHSLPEIGEAFGGRDHTTVLHACKKVSELKETDLKFDEDYRSLVRILTS